MPSSSAPAHLPIATTLRGTSGRHTRRTSRSGAHASRSTVILSRVDGEGSQDAALPANSSSFAVSAAQDDVFLIDAARPPDQQGNLMINHECILEIRDAVEQRSRAFADR